MRARYGPAEALDVVDIGCGAGTSSFLWAELGHRVCGLDINEPLIGLARARAAESGLDVAFEVGSATDLPWPDGSKDVCLVPELLEHVEPWQRCLDEFARVLRPKGLLLVTTTNKLCPAQDEFRLPLYSWYPAALKRRMVALASTSRPEIAGHATYPAVNWFTFYGLRAALAARGFTVFLDRFDAAVLREPRGVKRLALGLIRSGALMRTLAYVGTRGTLILALKAPV